MNERVLIVDDEAMVRKSVEMVFHREGMIVTTASGGQEALDLLEKSVFDLIILDVMMTPVDGFYVINEIRKRGIVTPVLFLSGNQEEGSKILGISLGGDDYLTKPFSLAMLTTKANALLRRTRDYNMVSAQILSCGQLHFDINTYEAYKNNEKLLLTSKETALLRFFMVNQNQVFSKEQLYDQVWNQDIVDNNTIMVYIKRLRDKIEDDPRNPKYLTTVWGLGYRFGLVR
jgi:DNA-binding response OmpR family regulator